MAIVDVPQNAEFDYNSHAMKNDPDKYPPGWDYKKAAAIARYYDERKDVNFFGEIEAAMKDPQTVMVQVPRDLLPKVLKLIEKKKKTA